MQRFRPCSRFRYSAVHTSRSTHTPAFIVAAETSRASSASKSSQVQLPTTVTRRTRTYLPHIPLSDKKVFWHVLAHFLMATLNIPGGSMLTKPPEPEILAEKRLKKVPPYWFAYTTMAKERWLGREVLEVVSTEFRDRSMEYYRYALESGVVTINGQVAEPDTIIRNGDRLESVVHKHEPSVTSTPVKIIHHEPDDYIVIDKPGSIPIHACGRYYRNSLVEILNKDFGFEKVHPVNRLDRLTSGLMILPLNSTRANSVSREFVNGTVKKEYVARVRGAFPEEELTCNQPLLTVDRQIGLNIVHPEGKPAMTIFRRMHYDSDTNTSVVHCRPQTGRSHQIRVHLQYLGYPIANDNIYSDPDVWGERVGKDGLDLTPSDERVAPIAPTHFSFLGTDNPEQLSASGFSEDTRRTLQSDLDARSGTVYPADKTDSSMDGGILPTTDMPQRKLLPRETGHDIGMASPVPLSAEMVKIITRLRNMKDEDEDWSRWRDVVFRGKAALSPHGVFTPHPLPDNVRKRGGAPRSKKKRAKEDATPNATTEKAAPVQVTQAEALEKLKDFRLTTPSLNAAPDCEVASVSDSAATADAIPLDVDQSARAADTTKPALYCPECYLPLHPDPKPERLYIFLHALRYTTETLGSFETDMPEWAAEGWIWDM